MTLKGGTSQACAACKYQRRRCTSECPLAPYFPPHEQKVFQNAHKLFGVSNILKILKKLDPAQKSDAMKSIIYQANVRDENPVHGCWGKICQLKYQIWQAEEELHAVHSQLDMYRQYHHHHHLQISSSMPDHDVTSQLELGMAPPSNALPLFNHSAAQPYAAMSVSGLPVTQQHAYSNSSNVVYNNSAAAYMDSKDNSNNVVVNPLWVQQHPYSNGTSNSNNNNNSMVIQSQLVASQQPVAMQQEVVQDYDEMHPFFDTIDDRQSYIDSKEAYESRYNL